MSVKKVFSLAILLSLAALIWLPLWMMISGSLMNSSEVTECIGPVINDTDAYAKFHILPYLPTFKPYVELLLDSPGFFSMFWNSCIQVFPGLAGQLLIAVPAAWGFARYRFHGRHLLFLLYITLMIMPFQVTMVSSYLVLNKFHFLNSFLAIIIPNIFATFPVFIMEKFFKAIPKPLIEAARIDGAGELKIFLKLGLPLGAPGIISVVVLGFLEEWNAIEQPLIFIKDKSLWPLSLYLPEIAASELGAAMVASVIAMLPALLIFLFGQEYLEQGIVAAGIKE